MICTNKVVFAIDKYDVAEMFYNENRNKIKEAIKGQLAVIMENNDIDELTDDTEVEVDIMECLSCSFNCNYINWANNEGECIFESFLKISIWDLKQFIAEGWPTKCLLKFPLVGTENGMLQPDGKEVEEMASYIEDMLRDDDKLLREIREYVTENN